MFLVVYYINNPQPNPRYQACCESGNCVWAERKTISSNRVSRKRLLSYFLVGIFTAVCGVYNGFGEHTFELNRFHVIAYIFVCEAI